MQTVSGGKEPSTAAAAEYVDFFAHSTFFFYVEMYIFAVKFGMQHSQALAV